MESRRRTKPAVVKSGEKDSSGVGTDVSTVEIDATFGRLLGLAERQKVYCPKRIRNLIDLKENQLI